MASALTNILQVLRLTPGTNSSATTKSSTKGRTGLREITLQEVSEHDCYDDCWVVIYDRVYDVTKFLREHPGGEDVIIDHAGRDATIAFHGTGHSSDAIEIMRDYLIGELPVQQCICRSPNTAVLLKGIPE